jgi:hypothetical protein
MKLRYNLRRIGESRGGCGEYEGRRRQGWTAKSCRIVNADHTSRSRRRCKCARSDHMRRYAVVQLLAQRCREGMDLDARTASEKILMVTRGIDDWHPASTKASRHEDSYG